MHFIDKNSFKGLINSLKHENDNDLSYMILESDYEDLNLKITTSSFPGGHTTTSEVYYKGTYEMPLNGDQLRECSEKADEEIERIRKADKVREKYGY